MPKSFTRLGRCLPRIPQVGKFAIYSSFFTSLRALSIVLTSQACPRYKQPFYQSCSLGFEVKPFGSRHYQASVRLTPFLALYRKEIGAVLPK